jgi:hypothetical protein
MAGMTKFDIENCSPELAAQACRDNAAFEINRTKIFMERKEWLNAEIYAGQCVQWLAKARSYEKPPNDKRRRSPQ